jgi:hypothetical protein
VDPAYLSASDGWTTAVSEAYFGAQKAVLAAESLGLGTIYIGTLRRDQVAVAEVLKLPLEVFAVAGISVGIPDTSRTTRTQPRLSQSVVFHRETYHPTDFSEIGGYDQPLAMFDRRERSRESLWSRRTTNRLVRGGSLAQAVRRLGIKWFGRT